MPTTQLLNTTIVEYWGKSSKTGDVGVEIEVEGAGLNFTASNFWKVEPESSLRSGVEYVLTKPVPMSKVSAAFEELSHLTRKAKFLPSLRTSVHVHVNMGEATVAELFTMLTTYWLIEDILVETQGPERKGNLHCLRATDADGLVNIMIDDMERGESGMNTICDDHYRYSAVNLAALRKFGSIEFRFLSGMTDFKEIERWVRALYDLVQNSKNLGSSKGVIKTFYASRLEDFLLRLFQPSFVEYLLKDSKLTKADLSENTGLLYRFAKAQRPMFIRGNQTIKKDEDLD